VFQFKDDWLNVHFDDGDKMVVLFAEQGRMAAWAFDGDAETAAPAAKKQKLSA
jgi:hypothetical protein